MNRSKSFCKDKQTFEVYPYMYIERNSTLFLELNQEIDVQPMDVVIELYDEQLMGYLIMDKQSFTR